MSLILLVFLTMYGIIALSFALFLSGCSSGQSKEEKDRAYLHMQMGTAHLKGGHYPRALSQFLKAKSLDPKNHLILNNLGLSYFVRGEFEKAKENFELAVKYQSDFTEGKNNLGRTLIELGESDKALTVLKEAKEDLTYSQPEKTLSNLGRAYFELGQFETAIESFRSSLKIRRGNCTTTHYYGRALLASEQLEKAAESFDAAIESCRKQQYADPIYFSGLTYFKLGNREKATARLEEITEVYPENSYTPKAQAMLKLLR